MTTAHRPTWKAAVGQANEGGWFAGGASTAQKSALDAPAHTKLKVRKAHQLASNNKDDLLRQSLLELEQAEIKKASSLPRKPINPIIEERAKMKLLKQTAEVDIQRIKDKYDDSDIDDDDDDDDQNSNHNNGGDDDSSTDLDDDNDDSDDDDDDDDDEDDEAALKAELDKIRAEREEMKRREDDIIAAEEKSKLEEAALFGNPLLHNVTNDTSINNGGRLKRRWNDDVVFRNQAASEPEIKKRFINDTVRNDFHKRFLQKFIR